MRDHMKHGNLQKLLTIKKAASIIGVQYRQLLEAVKCGDIPHYKIKSSRMLVSVPEIMAIMKNGEG